MPSQCVNPLVFASPYHWQQVLPERCFNNQVCAPSLPAQTLMAEWQMNPVCLCKLKMAMQAMPLNLASRVVSPDSISDWPAGPWDRYAGDSRGQVMGMHTASTSSLQHEEGVNGVNGVGALPHPAHVRTASVADSGDDAAYAAGVFLVVIMHHMRLLVMIK